MKLFITSFLLMVIYFVGNAQVVMNLQLPPAGLTAKEQLWNLSLVNSGQNPLRIQLEMQLNDASGNQRVLTAVTREIVLEKGVRQIRYADIQPITYNVVNPSYSVDASPSGLLPIGVFNICYTVYSSDAHGERMSDECETVEVEPVSPPSLLIPEDQEETEITRPQFSRIPPAPVQLFSRLSYDVVVVEVLPTQSPTDAIARNIPVLLLSDVRINNAAYPSAVKELDTARTYAWRIKANSNGMPVANSETWTFRVIAPQKNKDAAPQNFAYTKLARSEDVAVSPINGLVNFQYTHTLNDTTVNIEVFDLSQAKRKKIPLEDERLTVRYGMNFLSINVDGKNTLIDRHIYLLQVINSRGDRRYLKFQYKK